MRIIGLAICVIALLSAAFGYWGMFTVVGESHFDEMDGMIPFFALCAGVLLGIVGVALLLIAWWRGIGLAVCIFGVISAIVGIWGLFSFGERGRRFDHMDGRISYLALWAAALLFAVGSSLMFIARWRRNRQMRGFPLD